MAAADSGIESASGAKDKSNRKNSKENKNKDKNENKKGKREVIGDIDILPAAQVALNKSANLYGAAGEIPG